MSAEAVAAPSAQPKEQTWTPTSRGWTARLIALGVIFGSIIWITTTVPGYWADRIALAAVWAIIGLSLNVVLGYVGQVSLGHHGFIGIAAFVAAFYATEQAGCTVEGGCSQGAFWAATFFAVISGALTAGLLGLVALRIKGLYLALITLAYGFMAERSIFEISALTRGGAGMPAPRPSGFTSDQAFAFLCFAFLALVLFIDWRLIKSKAGRAILSIKHSEAVAASYGVNVTAYKVLAFVLSGVFAGLAGSLLAFHTENVVANDFQSQIALLWVLMVVVGGLGNRTGVVIGSAFFALFQYLIPLLGPVERFLSATLGREPDEIALVIGALLAILTIVQYPGGIAEQISPITRWLRGEKFSMHPEGHGSHKKSHGPNLLQKFRKRPGRHSIDGASPKTPEKEAEPAISDSADRSSTAASGSTDGSGRDSEKAGTTSGSKEG
jgi:branched-chain amino acid transport system permease protein